MTMPAQLVGGLREGETVHVNMPFPVMRAPGLASEAIQYLTPDGDIVMSFPVEFYRRLGGPPLTYHYERTEPASVPEGCVALTPPMRGGDQ